jgi:replicative DNA helicase
MSRNIIQREAKKPSSEADREAPTPLLSDLRDGSFEYDADVVIFVSRDDMMNPSSSRKDLVDIIIGKHRDGPVGELTVFCSPQDQYLHDLECAPASHEGEET